MFEDLVSNLLSTYLGDYLEGLSKKDLKISLWNGDVELKNIVRESVSRSLLESKDGGFGFFEPANPSEGRVCRNPHSKGMHCEKMNDLVDTMETSR